MNRRNFLFRLAIMGCGTFVGPHLLAAGDPYRGGCCIRQEQAATLNYDIYAFHPANQRIINTTGNDRLDRQLGRALVKLAQQFGVRPGFGLFRDGSQPNAYAMPESLLANTQGTVLLGKTLFQDRLTRYSDAGIALLAICAHEFGHIFQFLSGYAEKLQFMDRTARPMELQADFLAGYYLGTLKLGNSDLNLQGAGSSFEEMGDYNFGHPNHHGTPDQRVAAIEAGYKLAIRKGVSVEEAAMAGYRHVAG